MLEFTDDPHDNLETFLRRYRYPAFCESLDQKKELEDQDFPWFHWQNQIALRGRESSGESVGGAIGESELNWPNYLLN